MVFSSKSLWSKCREGRQAFNYNEMFIEYVYIIHVHKNHCWLYSDTWKKKSHSIIEIHTGIMWINSHHYKLNFKLILLLNMWLVTRYPQNISLNLKKDTGRFNIIMIKKGAISMNLFGSPKMHKLHNHVHIRQHYFGYFNTTKHYIFLVFAFFTCTQVLSLICVM